jgi:mono/diheme cytochrome c family protein
MKQCWSLGAILALLLSGCEPMDRPSHTPRAVPRAEAAALFARHCSICHGEHGDGQGPRRGSLHDKPPNFRLSGWQVGTTLSDIRQSIRHGRPGTDMPAWKTLSDEEIAGLAEYVVWLGTAQARVESKQ